MGSVSAQHQRVGRESGKDRMGRTDRNLFWSLFTLLMLHLPSVTSLTIQGQKDGSITFPCSSTRKNVSIRLTYGSRIAYGAGQSDEYKDRVHESGNCNLVLRALKTTDAGKYTFHIYPDGFPTVSISYEIQVTCNLSVRKGEELKFDDLPWPAQRVEHYTDAGWTEMWKRGQDVNRLTDKNGSLTISNFTSSNAGTYRVLNETGGIMIVVNVTESSLISSEEKQRTSSSTSRLVWSAALPFLIWLSFWLLNVCMHVW